MISSIPFLDARFYPLAGYGWIDLIDLIGVCKCRRLEPMPEDSLMVGRVVWLDFARAIRRGVVTGVTRNGRLRIVLITSMCTGPDDEVIVHTIVRPTHVVFRHRGDLR